MFHFMLNKSSVSLSLSLSLSLTHTHTFSLTLRFFPLRLFSIALQATIAKDSQDKRWNKKNFNFYLCKTMTDHFFLSLCFFLLAFGFGKWTMQVNFNAYNLLSFSYYFIFVLVLIFFLLIFLIYANLFVLLCVK